MEEQIRNNKENVTLLAKGKVPSDSSVLRKISVGVDFLTDFLDEQYLQEYIAEGGSKIKFVSGRPGSGKTHFAQLLIQKAQMQDYIIASFSAKEISLYDFREIYLEILRQCNLEQILQDCAQKIVQEMGFDPSQIRPDSTFMDLLFENGEADAISKGTIRSTLRTWFTKNPLLDNMFAGCCSLLTGGILGHPVLEKSNHDLIYSFLHGDKTVKLSQLRALGLSPSRITKYNARYLLRSLAEVIRLSGRKGLLVVIDDLETLLNKTSQETIRYTKLRREDTYESIRQLIDDIDNMRYLMFVLCFDRELMDNESYGLKSYQALWMRIQNEVVSTRLNRFADILDMDRLADQIYTPQVLAVMADNLYAYMNAEGYPAQRLTQDSIQELIRKAEYGGIGIPYLVNRAVLEEEEPADDLDAAADGMQEGSEYV